MDGGKKEINETEESSSIHKREVKSKRQMAETLDINIHLGSNFIIYSIITPLALSCISTYLLAKFYHININEMQVTLIDVK